MALRFSDYFIENAQYDKCVSMLVLAGELERAIAAVSRYTLPMDSALAAKLTPSRGAVNFKRVLCALAECCAAQRCHELACAKLTKFTQCGEKAKAMRCLIQCGDTRAESKTANASFWRRIICSRSIGIRMRRIRRRF